ncbi:hypothetical protein GS905_20230 [Rhodococcus hoagii]|uniref:PASTA domain-containing protein n=2 Tax=Rhodococcus hoagii TaxID=43767 RepID=A0A9Q2PHC6_RHOHA|nr:hypothetical protein C7H75_08730 [Prescottella equi]MBU4617683.1 hypothetical protein [Rhodococcus sp. GG48]MBM4480483.1 hypothetical protein [Prescottella equi]MBM4481934.1 hypothetical protein [Prescottella equi]MBM4487085.1 hypothetical protein [Prescottella equi]
MTTSGVRVVRGNRSVGVAVALGIGVAVAGSLSACGSSDDTTAAVQATTTATVAAPATSLAPPVSASVVVPSPTVPAPASAPASVSAPTLVPMPNVMCMNLQDAQDLIQEHGVFFSRSADASGKGRNQVVDSNWIVVGQTPAVGALIGEGDAVLSVVKIGEPNPC